ncbi:phosphate ABC transporter permease subunit PstC [Acidithiobacillus ferrivorans]|uniref:phosphate ABC transporter permease subunit PstC n=1 Tax=Acidithiobacillus ferrivorans TaxID=160808 RepID=UPI001C074C7C|nr:phosphate ABC transporter permease subunit PstC [Acidithiobacillus ferrivorans]MBU2765733.1 phosphate ABC transporter permease subunit PstC [Acidithiobacillus ferrivorans]MBU2850881.1 phosphate ABC transporter permease subunit PstC [Acidithiobacillus ferrivorans]
MKIPVFRVSLIATASFLPLSLISLIVFLAIYSWPAIQFNQFHFLWTNDWNLGNLYGNPVTVHGTQIMPGAKYGIWFLVVGTIVSSALAMLIAMPIAIGAAYFLSEGVRKSWAGPLSLFVDLLAAIPSVVYGLWGYALLVPLFGQTIFPFMAKTFSFIPFLNGDPGSGYGLLTSAFVLAVMIIPLISATLRESIRMTEPELKEAGLSLGLNRLEVFWHITLPKLKTVLIGVGILALGRALGETMAVLMVSGNALNYLPNNIYAPISTMAAFIASQLDSALQDPTNMAVEALSEIALVLLLITVVVNFAARLLLWMARVR